MTEIKKGWKNLQQKRFKQKGLYKFDRWIMKAGMIIAFSYLLFVACSYNFDLDYYNCPNYSDGSISGPTIMLKDFDTARVDGKCKNPFYKASDWKNEEYLAPGEYGTKLGYNFKLAPWVVVAIMILALILNHLIHNKNFTAPKNFGDL